MFMSHAPQGQQGYDILDPEGEVVAWTVDGPWAAVIVDCSTARRTKPRAFGSTS